MKCQLNALCCDKILNSLAFHSTQSDVLWTYLLLMEAGPLRIIPEGFPSICSYKYQRINFMNDMILPIFLQVYSRTSESPNVGYCSYMRSFEQLLPLFQKYSSKYHPNFRLSTFSFMRGSSGCPKFLTSQYIKVHYSHLLPDICILTFHTSSFCSHFRKLSICI